MNGKTFRWQRIMLCFDLLGLSIWIGGLSVIIIAVIPAVFNSLGLEPGGRFLRKVFEGYNTLTIGIILYLIISAAIRSIAIHRTKDNGRGLSGLEVSLLIAIVCVTVLITKVLGPDAIRLQDQAFSAKSELTKKAAYESFFRVHMAVRGLYFLNLGLSISLFFTKVWQGTRTV